MATTAGCSIAAESTFGPQVDTSCLHGFDFTLLFEESVLTLVPLGLVLLLAPQRIIFLHTEPVKTIRSGLYWSKIVSYFSLTALQAALLGFWARSDTIKTSATLATSIVALAASPILLYISHLEHRRAVRPSTLLNVYLGLSTILDIARVRTIWYISSYTIIAPVFLASYLVKTLIFGLETCEKRAHLSKPFADVSDEDVSGVLNRGLFLWINRLLLHGSGNILRTKTLPQISDDLTACSDPITLDRKWASANHDWEHSLLWVYVCHYKWAFAAGLLPKLAWIGFTFAQPFLVERVLDFIDDPDVQNANNVAYGLIAAYAIVYIGLAVSYAFYEHKVDRLVVQFRGSLVHMIFDKTLRLKEATAGEGSALTLFCQDVDRVALGLRQIHETWSAFIEVGVALWLLERLLGAAVAASALFIALILVGGIPLANAAGNAQGEWLEVIEERLAATSKALESMTLVRMTGAVQTVSTIITRLRAKEIKASGRFRMYTTFVITFAWAADAFTAPLGFGTFIILAEIRGTGTLTQGTAFAALTLFSFINTPLSTLMTAVEEAKILINSFDRIQKHLLEREQLDYRLTSLNMKATEDEEKAGSLSSAGSEHETMYEMGQTPSKSVSSNDALLTLQDVSLYWKDEGKPTLRNLNIRLQRHELTMVIGPVGAGKTSLLKVLLGEASRIDGRITTSFHQVAYCSQAPWLRYGTVRDNIVGGCLWNQPKYQEVIAVCGLEIDFHELADGDQTKVGVKGSQLSGGQQKRISLARALYSDLPVLILDDPITGLDRKTEKTVLEKVFSANGFLKRRSKSTVMATNSAHHLPFADTICVMNTKGEIEHQGSYDNLLRDNDYVQRLRDQPQTITSLVAASIDPNVEGVLQEAGIELEEDMKDKARSTGDMRVYLYYFQTAGWMTIALYLLTAAGFTFGITFPTVWLQWWTLENEQYGTQRLGYWLGIYAALGAIALVSTFAGSYILLMVIVPTTARRFHKQLLDTTTRAATSYLIGVDTGSILNRFSQDLELIDLELPEILEEVTVLVMSMLAEGVLVFIGSGYFAATIPGVIVMLYLIQKYYLRTSRQLRLLDIEAKAPLYTHFLEAMNGLASVRAYGLSDAYRRKNHKILNDSQKPYYLLFTVQRWLTLVLNLIVAGLSIILVGVVTTVRNSQTVFIGTALFNIVSFGGTLETLITEWTELEQSIGAVSRIKSYVSATPREAGEEEDYLLPPDWPSDGCIEFQNLSASYESSEKPVLHNLDFKIDRASKVAICGRTGSGKSSLISALLRQVELSAGRILIDGIDIATVPRQSIRARINTIPQETFFVKGSVRLNLDLQEQVESDEVLTEALEAIGLLEIFENSGGLDADMDESVLSHGQRQLFCLARALCTPGRIVILDEPTSSVDADTEALMQSLIRERFKGRTVIAIVHKLHSVLEFDKVLLLDKGQVAEYDSSQQLLNTPGSRFKELYDTFSKSDDRCEARSLGAPV